MLYKTIWFFFMLSHYRSSTVSAHFVSSCRLENRTMTLPICHIPPRIVVPVCVGYCSSTTRWNFARKHFNTQVKACTVTDHDIVTYTCQDSTHTSLPIMIPKSCSCDLHLCRNRHENIRFF